MGESRNLFNIPAYIKVGDKRFKVIKWGIAGAVIENVPFLESEENITADFIFPYDAYNELVIPEVKLRCAPENGTLFCRFENLSKDQEKLLKFLIREYLWRRIISIPSEFMNYTQDSEVRRELLSFQRNLTLKKRLKRVMYLVGFVGLTGIILLGARTLFYGENTGLTVKYSETNGMKKTQANGVELAINENKNNNKSDKKNSSGNFLKSPHPKVEAKVEKKTDKRKINTKGKTTTTNSLTEKSKTVKTANEEKSAEKKELLRTGKYYCVQVATDVSAQRLIKLAKELKGFPYVRVEKIGNFYTLRVGFDQTYREDKKLAREIKKRIHRKVFPRVCAYKPERWVYPQTEVK